MAVVVLGIHPSLPVPRFHVKDSCTNAVGFYDRFFTSIEEIDTSTLGAFLEVPNYTGRQLITSGQWRVVDNSPDLLVKASIPELRVVSDVYYGDTLVKQVSSTEFRNYPELMAQGGGFVENKLRKYFAENKTFSPNSS